MTVPSHNYRCDRCGKDFHCPKGAFGTHRRWCGWSLADRFWPKVDKRGPDECWPWIGSRKPRGYGHMIVGKKDHNAHRVSYELAYGKPPADMEVIHSCDNPPCVNPAHLSLGTHNDNMDDMRAKGRRAYGEATKRHKLTSPQVLDLRAAFRRTGQLDYEALANKHGVTASTIYKAATGQSWRFLP